MANADTLHTIKITLPEISIDKKLLGLNRTIQLAQRKDTVEVEIYPYKEGIYLAKDQFGVQRYLLSPGFNVHTKSQILKLPPNTGFSEINESTKLTWYKHPLITGIKDPEKLAKTWVAKFNFTEESDDKPGLRLPQIGAIHSIFSQWSINNNVGTIVMPTGTGKTEVMLSTLIYGHCTKVLVLVSSADLRTQMLNKFSTLGYLREVGAIDYTVLNPRVTMLSSGIKDADKALELINSSNVLISTVDALRHFPDHIKQLLAIRCSHLFIDEAHHVPAASWDEIKSLFENNKILQFTATPFRRDGKRISGDIFYNYPLGMAQDAGYFKHINLIKIQEFDDRLSDAKIAQAAIAALRSDLAEGYDHIIMARCKDTGRVSDILDMYRRLAPDLNPVAIYSDLPQRELTAARQSLGKDARIVVCVNMLGEGFDLPNLKIAAIHDAHKSLAITLQFIGRFTRKSHNVSDATVVINTADPKVNKELESLYSDDTTDWDKILREKSESAIKREIEFHDFIKNFKGDLSSHISLWNLRPSFSTLIYETKCDDWNPRKALELLPADANFWWAINDTEKVLVIVIGKEEEVNWGKYKDIKNQTFDLCVIHWSEAHNALFINSSDYDLLNTDKIAEEVCGAAAKIKNGNKVFNIYSAMERVLAKNVGVKTVGNISYTMHFGDNITEGLSQVDKATSVLNNIFGWGYEDGERVTRGCSAKKGKIWSRGGGPILIWKQWCHMIADKVFDDSIEDNRIIADFLRPQTLTDRHPSLPILAEWSESLLVSDEDSIALLIGKQEFKFYDINLEIIDHSTEGPIKFKVGSGDMFATYQLEVTSSGYSYRLVSGSEVKIRRRTGDYVTLTDHVKTNPITIIYIDGSFSYNNFHVPTPSPKTFFNIDSLTSFDWSSINTSVESIGKELKTTSVQYRAFEAVKDDYEVIFNDDSSGEAADIIALRQESPDSLRLHLIHCKYSSLPAGSRVKDFYELCGQAQKSIKWKHGGVERLCDHMLKREKIWQEEGFSRFLKGNSADLNRLRKFSRHATKVHFEVTIVQPGLSKAQLSEDVSQLLGSTEAYLLTTTSAKFNVICAA